MAKSIEEMIEDIAKEQLRKAGVKYFIKNENVNSEIDNALQKAKSKSGNNGGNFPDIKVLLQLPNGTYLPVMIEVKGTKGYLEKLGANGEVTNYDDKGAVMPKVVQKYAVNGAIHYAEAIIGYTRSYKSVLAIGVNGYNEGDKTHTEFGVYYISRDNSMVAKKVAEYSDLSFLGKQHLPALIENIRAITLTEAEKELKRWDYENQIEYVLKNLNQQMQDQLQIKAESRVQLVCGMIMAALGVPERVAELHIEDLRGELGREHDGARILNKVNDFIDHKKLPVEKKETISDIFSVILNDKNYYTPKNGESALKTVFRVVEEDIMPIFTSANHLDFTGRMFNVLTSWIPLRPGDDQNDVVLTPRYVTEFMAKLCRVNRNSYVWDYTAGSGGFLISAMKLMVEDAEKNIQSEHEKTEKINHIKFYQLLGVELRPEIYILAVLNMILMGDGSSHILNMDVNNYDGTYNQSIENEGKDLFPADVFLLNPPYSADGKGFVFVKQALERMQKGYAAILIMESAGKGGGLPYTAEILKNNTLLASIHMSDIFCGKAGVQTAIYLFKVGEAHDPKSIVRFIDFTNDGYQRQNRKKASASVNLRDTDHAVERYEEVVNLVLHGRQYLHYFSENEYMEDTISLSGKDWTFSDHVRKNTVATELDFRRTIADYLSWKVSTIIKQEGEYANFQ